MGRTEADDIEDLYELSIVSPDAIADDLPSRALTNGEPEKQETAAKTLTEVAEGAPDLVVPHLNTLIEALNSSHPATDKIAEADILRAVLDGLSASVYRFGRRT